MRRCVERAMKLLNDALVASENYKSAIIIAAKKRLLSFARKITRYINIEDSCGNFKIIREFCYHLFAATHSSRDLRGGQ